MKKNLYLLYSHYNIRENDSSSKIIYRAAKKSYRDFCRQLSFLNRIPSEKNADFEKETELLLSNMIPNLLKSTSQEVFDTRHHEICNAIIHVYDSIGGQPYGIAQRWLNLTLLNLVIIESNLTTGYWPIMDARKYFHVPVDNYLLEAATSKQKNRFQHGLNLKCAPLRHGDPDIYQMDWFIPGETQPFKSWEYSEYIELQLTIRDKINELRTKQDNLYEDCLDWAIYAFLEVSQKKIKD